MKVSLAAVENAQKRIAGGIYFSPCPKSIPLSELCGSEVYCKLEYLQRTGSFKERGARNALLKIDEAQRRRGVVAASAGNHALGLAYHGKMLAIPVTVVMPVTAPLIKRFTCEGFGARVVLSGENFNEACTAAIRIAETESLHYVHGFDDEDIIAGQGTCGLEILQQIPDADALIVPVGGGGLIAGIAAAAKALKPRLKIIGVEPENAACFKTALDQGHPQKITLKPTIADGLAVAEAGSHAFEIAKNLVDEMVTVSEPYLELAILRILELEKGVVEGAGAAALAALMQHPLPELKGKKIVIILSGGNIDPMVLGRVIEKAMVSDERLCRFTAIVSDRPGGLSKLSEAIASAGAQIKEIFHDRIFSGPDISSVNILCIVEIHNRAHRERLYEAIRKKGIQVIEQS
jgi:threonine dehydratase